MFNRDRWEELFETIAKNKLRTVLTGISVASGIFILVLLLGVGQGLQNGIENQFQDDAKNRLIVYTGRTTKGYKGMNPGREIELRNKDFDFASRRYEDNIEYKSPKYRIWSSQVNYENETGNYRVEGVYGDNQFLESATMVSGRFVNTRDQKKYEKNAAIGYKVKTELFKDKEAVGKFIKVANLNFKVVGVFSDPGGDREESRVFIPLSTAQRVFNGGDTISSMTFTLPQAASFDKALKTSDYITANLEKQIKERYTVAPDDNSAVTVRNTLESAQKIYSLLNMVNIFFWIVGIMTIFAGIVGVGNIMLIIVKERTKEIGIRKALGAKPWSIVGMILHESIFVTFMAGFFGLFLGLLLLEFVAPLIDTDFISNPSVNFNIALTTVFILVLAGAIAGFFPAWKAARIKPITALRNE
jgi:putative ABC transport system permease protein